MRLKLNLLESNKLTSLFYASIAMNTIYYVGLEMKWPPMFTTVDSGPISYRVLPTCLTMSI